MSAIRAFEGVNSVKATASPSVAQGSALGTKLSSRLNEFITEKDKK